MLKKKTIEIPIYPIEVNFIAGDYIEFLEYISWRHGCNIDPKDNIAETHLINGHHYIWFEEDTITTPIMIHELGHVTFNIMNYLGLELTDQEAFCYMQEYLYEQISKYVHNLHGRSI